MEPHDHAHRHDHFPVAVRVLRLGPHLGKEVGAAPKEDRDQGEKKPIHILLSSFPFLFNHWEGALRRRPAGKSGIVPALDTFDGTPVQSKGHFLSRGWSFSLQNRRRILYLISGTDAIIKYRYWIEKGRWMCPSSTGPLLFSLIVDLDHMVYCLPFAPCKAAVLANQPPLLLRHIQGRHRKGLAVEQYPQGYVQRIGDLLRRLNRWNSYIPNIIADCALGDA